MISDLQERLKGPLCVDAPVPMAIIGPDYRFRSINKRWSDLFGWSESELDGGHIIDAVPSPDDARELDRKLILMTSGASEYDRMQLIIKTKIDVPRKINLSMFGIFDEDRGGKFDFAILYALDHGAYIEVEEVKSRIRRLWPYIVITTTLLWFADFGELVNTAMSYFIGGEN